MDDKLSTLIQKISEDDNQTTDTNISIEKMLSQIREDIEQEIMNRCQQEMDKLSARIDELAELIAKGNKPTNVSSTPFTPSPNTLSQEKMCNISLNCSFKYGEWIFYVNEDNGDFLYKVKKDGTQNTQLTDYSIEVFFKIKDGYLYFDDSEGKQRKIKL